MAVAVGFLGAPPVSFPQAESATIDGLIIAGKSQVPVLQTRDKRIGLYAGDESLKETLRDPRVSGKHLRLEGRYRTDGSFEVTDVYVVHPDGLYRIIYFCNVCHITAFKPGNCVCCQQPTELQEVPLTDPRVYHDPVTSPHK